MVTAAALAAACLAALPLLYLVIRTLALGPGALSELFRPRVFEIWFQSALLALTVSAASVMVGVPLAWLTSRSDLPARRIWGVLACLPLVIPSYVGGFALVAALGPRGVISEALGSLGLRGLPNVYGFGGAALALTLLSYPYVLLTTQAALLMLDAGLEEAAATLGHTRWSIFRRVTLPLLKPSILSGALLVALYALSDFGAVSLLQFDSFTRVIYVQYRASFDRNAAAFFSMLLVILTVLLLAAEGRASGQAAHYRSARPSLRPPLVRLGFWKTPALLFCAVVVFLALGVPVAMTVYWAFRNPSLWNSLAATAPVLGNSLYVSMIAAGAATLAAFPIALRAARFGGGASRILQGAAHLGYALPGIVIALSLVFFAARYVPTIYQTLALLVFAYGIRFLPQAINSERAALLQINPRIEEAALTLGQSAWRVLARVTIPLARSGFVSAFALVFLTTMKELPATLLLAPTGFRTLATEIWAATDEAFYSEAALPALLLIAAALGSVAILTRHPGTAPQERGGHN